MSYGKKVIFLLFLLAIFGTSYLIERYFLLRQLTPSPQEMEQTAAFNSPRTLSAPKQPLTAIENGSPVPTAPSLTDILKQTSGTSKPTGKNVNSLPTTNPATPLPQSTAPTLAQISNGDILLREDSPFSGIVKNVDKDNNLFILTISALRRSTLTGGHSGSQQNSSQWTINLTKDTSLYQLVRKDRETILREVTEFQKRIDALPKNSSGSNLPTIMPPSSFFKEKSDLSSLETGLTVTVTGKNIDNDNKTLTAVNIEIACASCASNAPVPTNDSLTAPDVSNLPPSTGAPTLPESPSPSDVLHAPAQPK